MIQKSNAIVLHLLKYSETSVITTLYSESFGRQSYMINGIRSPKSKQKMGLLQPLFLLEIEAYHKAGRDVQRMKEFRPGAIYSSIPFNIVKSTMAMFMAEILYKVLRSEEPDHALYEFLVRSLQYFDTLEKGTANFHLWFLIRLLSYLGYRLGNNYAETRPWFDLKNSEFVSNKPMYPNTPDLDESAIIANFLAIDVADLEKIHLNGALRSRVLEIVTEYYTIHFDGIGTINSLRVLNEIFR